MCDTMLSFWCQEGLVVSLGKASHLIHIGELHWVLSISFRARI